MSSLQQSEHTRVVPRVMKEPPCPTEGNVCFFFLCQFTEFHSTLLWATFYFFMILHLLEALCLVTEGWLSCQLQRRTFWFAAMARWTTQQVTFHFLHSKQILFSLTLHRRFFGENFGGRGFKPRKHVCCTSPNPPFVSWKSGVKDGEALKGRGFKPFHLYCKINLWILIFF